MWDTMVSPDLGLGEQLNMKYNPAYMPLTLAPAGGASITQNIYSTANAEEIAKLAGKEIEKVINKASTQVGAGK
jgi:hypothetical protein